MEVFIEILKEINVSELIAMGIMLWFFYSRMEKKFDKINDRFEKVDARFEKVDARFEKIEITLNDIDKRVFGIETMLHMKDCCILKSDQQIKKAE
jgi:predicted  nucleic acid-binding Zn-ribbon protein